MNNVLKRTYRLSELTSVSFYTPQKSGISKSGIVGLAKSIRGLVWSEGGLVRVFGRCKWLIARNWSDLPGIFCQGGAASRPDFGCRWAVFGTLTGIGLDGGGRNLYVHGNVSECSTSSGRSRRSYGRCRWGLSKLNRISTKTHGWQRSWVFYCDPRLAPAIIKT
jgi:hypothetical protein